MFPLCFSMFVATSARLNPQVSLQVLPQKNRIFETGQKCRCLSGIDTDFLPFLVDFDFCGFSRQRQGFGRRVNAMTEAFCQASD